MLNAVAVMALLLTSYSHCC